MATAQYELQCCVITLGEVIVNASRLQSVGRIHFIYKSIGI